MGIDTTTSLRHSSHIACAQGEHWVSNFSPGIAPNMWLARSRPDGVIRLRLFVFRLLIWHFLRNREPNFLRYITFQRKPFSGTPYGKNRIKSISGQFSMATGYNSYCCCKTPPKHMKLTYPLLLALNLSTGLLKIDILIPNYQPYFSNFLT